MKKSWYTVPLICLLLGACSSTQEHASNGPGNDMREGEGGRYYGGIFRTNETEFIKNLYPPAITDVYSYRVANQIYEGLFRLKPDNLTVINGLAESYSVDETNTVYTIRLRDDVYFHDDPCFSTGKGRKLIAQDVAFCFTQLCTKSSLNQNFAVFSDLIKGANAYYLATAGGNQPATGVSGIEVLDTRTLRLTLTRPNSMFLMHLARPACYIYPPEAWEKYGADMRSHPVGTGPFRLGIIEENISIVLPKNERYWRTDSYGNQLPFLDALNIQFINTKNTELLEFRKGNLDMIYRLPTEHIIEILENNQTGSGEFVKYELQREPEMVTQYLTFNMSDKKLFSNKDIRKAISYAIDREKILNFALNNEGYAPGHQGITPPTFADYNINDIPGYRLNVDSARYYLSRAGYPNGKGFPKIELMLNAEGDRNTNVAVEIQKQLNDYLNIQVEINTYPMAQLLDRAFTGKFELMRSAWYADYPSPENFLWVFYSGSADRLSRDQVYPNIARYNNVTFNRLYEQALQARSLKEANDLFLRAEKVLMKDAPVIVLWYDEGYRLLQSYVKNFPNNPMQYRDLGEVYFQQARTLRAQ